MVVVVQERKRERERERERERQRQRGHCRIEIKYIENSSKKLLERSKLFWLVKNDLKIEYMNK